MCVSVCVCFCLWLFVCACDSWCEFVYFCVLARTRESELSFANEGGILGVGARNSALEEEFFTNYMSITEKTIDSI